MGTSVRTLQRRLSLEQTSYRKVLELARLDAALRGLEQSDEPLSQIALKLGFSEQSAFSRAFRDWTGVSPRSYRRQRASSPP